jgi:hypothetical protein
MSELFRIFLSHKHEDQAAAHAIKERLELYSARIRVLLAEDIEAGSDWYGWIRQQLEHADMLLLLFNGPHASWDWPLYEVGLYMGTNDERYRPVVCLLHPDQDPPSPLQHLQTVKAAEVEIEGFLKELFGGTVLTGRAEPLNASFARNERELTEAAMDIASYFKQPALEHWVYFNRFLNIHVQDPKSVTKEGIPYDTCVISDQRTLEHFGLTGSETTWGALVKVAEELGDVRWIQQVTSAVYKASRRRIPKTVEASFVSILSETFSPGLYRADSRSDGSMVFYLLLVKESAADFGNVMIPRHVAALATVLRAAFRFRWEVLERFKGVDFRKAQDIESLKNVLGSIERDAESHGLVDQDRVVGLFHGEKASLVAKILRQWTNLHTKGGSGSLDSAIECQDAPAIEAILADMLPKISKLVEEVALRFSEIACR